MKIIEVKIKRVGLPRIGMTIAPAGQERERRDTGAFLLEDGSGFLLLEDSKQLTPEKK